MKSNFNPKDPEITPGPNKPEIPTPPATVPEAPTPPTHPEPPTLPEPVGPEVK